MFTLSLRHPLACLTALAVGLLLSMLALPRASVDFSIERMYPDDSPSAAQAREHRARFGREDGVLLIIPEEGTGPMDPVLETASQALEQGAHGLTALTHAGRVQTLDRGPDGSLVQRSLRAGEVPPLLSGALISPDGRTGAIAAQLAPEVATHRERDALLTQLETLLQSQPGSWALAGLPVVRTWYVRLMLGDLRLLIPVATLISATFFVLAFRDLRHVLLGVLAIVSGGLLAAGAHVALGAPFDMFAPAFLAVVLVVGTSDVIHLVHRFGDRCSETPEDWRRAAEMAAREVGMACLLTSSTTALGFFALRATLLPPIRSFGVATGIGVVLAFVATMLLVPPALAWLGPPRRRALDQGAAQGARLGRLARRLTARPRRTLLLATLPLLPLVACLPAVSVEYRILEDLSRSGAVATAQARMEQEFGGMLPLEVSVQAPGDPLDPLLLGAVDRTARWLRAQEPTGLVVSVADPLHQGWTLLSGDEGLPPTQPAAAQTLLALELAGADPQAAFISRDGDRSHLRIAARMRDVGHHATVQLVDDLRAKLRQELAPLGATATVTGVGWLAQEVNGTMTRQFFGSFGLALGLIALLALVLTRSPRRTAVALVPNTVPVLLHLGLLGALGLALKPSTAMVMSIGLGIAVDDTIHILAVYERERTRGATARAAVEVAYREAGRSVLATSVLLATGFCAFVGSTFVGTLSFGLLTAWAIVTALYADLFLLGPLLVLVDRR